MRAFWAEMQLGLAARRLRDLIKIQEKPHRAIADMIMGLSVALLGGGYGLMLLILIVYKQSNDLPVGTELFSLLGPGSLVLMGFHRLIEASAELAQTEKMIARVRRQADARGWDLNDAMVGLR